MPLHGAVLIIGLYMYHRYNTRYRVVHLVSCCWIAIITNNYQYVPLLSGTHVPGTSIAVACVLVDAPSILHNGTPLASILSSILPSILRARCIETTSNSYWEVPRVYSRVYFECMYRDYFVLRVLRYMSYVLPDPEIWRVYWQYHQQTESRAALTQYSTFPPTILYSTRHCWEHLLCTSSPGTAAW